MKIPVFVSCPTALSPAQEASRGVLMDQLQGLNLEPRALGRSDYPAEFPLREVLVIARHCAGGLILGFEQFRAAGGVWKPGIRGKERVAPPSETISFPTPWNQLEAGILFGLGLPLLIFREECITGGVFDNGVTDVFIHTMPVPHSGGAAPDGLRDVLLKWYGKVSQHYYSA